MERTKNINFKDYLSELSEYSEIVKVGTNSYLKLKDIRPIGSLTYFKLMNNYDNELWKTIDTTFTNTDATIGSTGTSFIGVSNIFENIEEQKSIDKLLIKFKYTPFYVYKDYYLTHTYHLGDPEEITADQIILTIGKHNTETISIKHCKNNTFSITIYDSLDNIVAYFKMELKLSVNVTYNFEIDIDLTKKEGEYCCWSFIDNVRVLSNSNYNGLKIKDTYGTKSVLKDINTIIIGDNFESYLNNNNFKISDLILIKNCLHTDGEIKDFNIPETVFSTEGQINELKTEIQTDKLKSILNYNSLINNSEIRIILKILDNNYIFYNKNTSTWETSDLSWAKSNIYTDYTDAILESLANITDKINILIYLKSNNGIDSPIFYSFDLKYNFLLQDKIDIFYTLVYAEFEGGKKSQCTIKALLNKDAIYLGKAELLKEMYITNSNIDGYAEILLPTTDDMNITDYYNIILSCQGIDYKTMKVKVPKTEVINLEDLRFTVP